MAGIGAAYSQLQTPQDNLTQNNLAMSQLFAGQAAEGRLRNERKQIRDEESLKEWEKENKLNFEDFKQSLTGSETYDDVGRDFTLETVDKYTGYYREAQDALKKGDFNKKREYETKMMKLKGFASQIKDLTKSVAERKAEYQDMVDKGEMDGVDYDTWEKEMFAIEGKKFKVKLDDTDNPVIVGVKTLDDGTEEPFSIPFAKIQNGEWSPTRKVPLLGDKGIVTSVLNSLGSYQKETKSADGLYKITSDLWDKEKTEATIAKLTPLVQSDKVMASLTNQFDSSSRKRSGFSKEEKDAMVEKLSKLVQSGYKQKYQEEFNKDEMDWKLAKERLAEDARQANQTAAVAIRGQNVTAATTKRGQDIHKAIEDAKNNPQNPMFVQKSGFYKAKSNDGKIREYKTIDLYDKKTGEQKPFIISMGNASGVSIKASSIAISKDGNLIRYRAYDEKGKASNHEISKYGAKPELFNDFLNQIKGRGGEVETTQPVSDTDIDAIISKALRNK